VSGPTAGAVPTPSVTPSAGGSAETADGCPTSVEAPNRKPVASRSGALVPPDAAKAVVCRYFAPEGGDSLPLAEVTAVPGDLGGLIGYLNALSEPAGSASGGGSSSSTAGGETMAGACSLMNASIYRIVFSYSDRRPVTLNVLPTCATVEREGVVRQLESITTLRGYWGD
jgi:hypothetical protein